MIKVERTRERERERERQTDRERESERERENVSVESCALLSNSQFYKTFTVVVCNVT